MKYEFLLLRDEDDDITVVAKKKLYFDDEDTNMWTEHSKIDLLKSWQWALVGFLEDIIKKEKTHYKKREKHEHYIQSQCEAEQSTSRRSRKIQRLSQRVGGKRRGSNSEKAGVQEK